MTHWVQVTENPVEADLGWGGKGSPLRSENESCSLSSPRISNAIFYPLDGLHFPKPPPGQFHFPRPPPG